MSENDLRDEFKKNVKCGHLSWVESHYTSIGFPDLNYCIDGVEGNIELKFFSQNNKAEVRPSQVRWINKRIRSQGRVYVLVKQETINGHCCYMLFSGEEILKIVDVENELWPSLCTWDKIWNEKMDWEELVYIITYKPIYNI